MRAAFGALVAVLGAVGVLGYLATREPDPARPARTQPPVEATPSERTSPGRPATANGRANDSGADVASPPAAEPVSADGSGELQRENADGIRALEERRLADAVRHFERCVAERPDVDAYTFNLGEALARFAQEVYSDGERERALELLERAHRLRPDREELAGRVARWREQLASDEALWSYETDHFELAFDARRDDLLYGAQDVLDVLEEAYVDYAARFGVDPVGRGRARVRVTITSRSDFQRATGLGEWAGGAFDGTIRMPLSDLGAERADWSRVLRHELVHVFVREVGGRGVPGWLNEGLSQWLEGDREELLATSRRRLVTHEPFSLEELTGSLIEWEDAGAVARAYAQAVLLVDAIALTYGEAVLFRMVEGVASGRAPAEVFAEHTLVPLSAVFDDLLRDLAR